MLALVDARSTEESQASLTSASSNRRSVEDSESGETAARVMVARSPTEELTLRLSAASAYNFIDGAFRLFEDGVELPIDGSDNRVEEDRRSLEASLDWNPRERWTVRATLGREAYEIESRGISSGMQTDPKGEISISFRPQPRTTLSFESQRDIGQLGFGQFIASSSLSSEILTAGASALEPQRSWSHSLTYDRRFGDAGVLRLDLSRQRIDNPVRAVALSDSVVVAQNTSPRTVDSVGASLELPFEQVGRGDLILTASLQFADSQTIDPVTGVLREVSGVTGRYWSLGLRRDPGDGRLSWGFSAWHRTNGDDYSVRRIRDSRFSEDWDAWVEWEPVDRLKLRTSFNGPSTRVERSRFFGSVRAVGLEPSFISTRIRNVDSSASLSVEWRRHENFEISGYLSTSPEVRQEESLTPFGGANGPILATRTATTPRAQIRFRFYR
jgi:hypothetical protein